MWICEDIIMSILSYAFLPFTLIPSGFWAWICGLYFFILVLPLLICQGLKYFLRRYQFSARPESFFCYSHIKLVVPLTRSATLVIAVRHLSVSWHRAKPFITFRVHGLNAHVVQYNVFKDADPSRYLSGVKAQLLADIKRRGLGAFYSFPTETNQQQYPFERVEGIVEDIGLRFTEAQTEFEKAAMISRIYDNAQQTPGNFNSAIPAANVKVLRGNESGIGLLCEMPRVEFSCANSKNASVMSRVSLLMSFKRTVNVSLETSGLDVAMNTKELSKVVSMGVDLLNTSSTCWCHFRLSQVQKSWTQIHERDSRIFREAQHKVREDTGHYICI
eukprot:TRINITY_DN12848_c0_g7_i1.p1 TRINITY_DN12848_c0_g7~~TRINITY_DN12848_c0_g7_i1.p1  ORF type:complete len:331 (+),score=42.59 TRINITY_DN12848_c0_g7_i1:113-1105(+)